MSGTALTFLSLQEKTKKILDIWVKGNTFPSTILSLLSDILKETEKGAHRYPYNVFAKYFFCFCNLMHFLYLLLREANN